MRRFLTQMAFRFMGVKKLYDEVVVEDRHENVKSLIRKDLQNLLEHANQNNDFFRGKFDEFLEQNRDATDETFFKAYSGLPAYSKQDYAEAGNDLLNGYDEQDVEKLELQFAGRPLDSLRRLRSGKFLMPMATGGSTSLPLMIHMTKHHMFSMLFTFFKCWYRMGWRPGDKILVFYPKNTYNIDDMAKFNRYDRYCGFRYQLFEKIDRDSVAELVEEINRFRPKMLLIFPSPLNMVAHTIRKYNLPLKHHPELINVSGETFFDCQKKNIQDVFSRSRVEDSYGSVELGELAHETENGLEVFANVAYVETAPNENGKPEMIITRLQLDDFPFIRYKMKDIADIEFRVNESGQEMFVISNIEGKDSNYILSHSGERFYPSFFNRFVNELNGMFDGNILEIKVYERGQTDLEVQFILRDESRQNEIREAACELLQERMGGEMNYDIRFVEFVEHDYRRKYRVIERIDDVEYAGGIVGNQQKLDSIARAELETSGSDAGDNDVERPEDQVPMDA
ncbi:MAG: hypothetical protein VX768_14190 [Planctomycetota bacterium]|nr:hypothetical protein [Planctomycetota bacterium]